MVLLALVPTLLICVSHFKSLVIITIIVVTTRYLIHVLSSAGMIHCCIVISHWLICVLIRLGPYRDSLGNMDGNKFGHCLT